MTWVLIFWLKASALDPHIIEGFNNQEACVIALDRIKAFSEERYYGVCINKG